MADECRAGGHRLREASLRPLPAPGNAPGQRRNGLQFPVADAPAADDETVLGRVAAAGELRDVRACQPVVGRLVRRDAVGMLRPEHRPGERFAGLDIDLRAVDGQPLFALGGIGAQLLLGKGRAEQQLFGHGERLGEEFREGGEIDVGVVAVDIDVVPRAVVVELFGDLCRGHRLRPFGKEVGCRRGREGDLLHGGSGTEDERDAQHLELVGRERVERHTVRQHRPRGLLYLDFRGGDLWLSCHFRAL